MVAWISHFRRYAPRKRQKPQAAGEEGAWVEVIVRAATPSEPSDTTEYLLSGEANRKHLMESIQNVERF